MVSVGSLLGVCVTVAVLYPSGEHGGGGGATEGETLEDLQPLRHFGDGPWQRSGGTGESRQLSIHLS